MPTLDQPSPAEWSHADAIVAKTAFNIAVTPNAAAWVAEMQSLMRCICKFPTLNVDDICVHCHRKRVRVGASQ
jgi:hypothetical protein